MRSYVLVEKRCLAKLECPVNFLPSVPFSSFLFIFDAEKFELLLLQSSKCIGCIPYYSSIMSRFKLYLLFGILALLFTPSSTNHSNNGTNRNGKRARTREQRQVEYERMKFRRGVSMSGSSCLSSFLSTTRLPLVDSSSSQSTISSVVTHDTYRRRRHEHDDQFQFLFIASQASLTQVTLHPFQHSSNVFLQNFTFVFGDLHIHSDELSMTPVDEILDNFPITGCFALFDYGVLHTKLYMRILYEKGKFLFRV